MNLLKDTKNITFFCLMISILLVSNVHAQKFVNSGVLALDCYFRLPEGYFLIGRHERLVWAGVDGGISLSKYNEGDPILDSDSAVPISTLEYKGYFVYQYETAILPATVITDKLTEKITVTGGDAANWKLFIDNCFAYATDSFDLIKNK